MIDVTAQLLILGGYLAVSIVVLMGCASILNFNSNKRIDDFKDLFNQQLGEQNKKFESLNKKFESLIQYVNTLKKDADIIKQIVSETLKK